MLDLASEGGIIEKAGSWYSYDGERIGQGREAARKFLKDNPETKERISQAVYELKGVKRKVPAGAAVAASSAAPVDAEA